MCSQVFCVQGFLHEKVMFWGFGLQVCQGVGLDSAPGTFGLKHRTLGGFTDKGGSG